jgi:hypothetical protein
MERLGVQKLIAEHVALGYRAVFELQNKHILQAVFENSSSAVLSPYMILLRYIRTKRIETYSHIL